MSEFSSEVELLVQPSSSSLRDARKEIEAELGDIEVNVTASTTGASSQAAGGRRIAGKERAMSRQLLTSQDTRLETAVDHLDYGIELDEERNDLLRELIDETESGNFTRARSGGVLGAGLLGIGAATALLGGALSGLKDFKLRPPNIPPLEVPEIPPLRIKKPDWIPIPVQSPTGTDTPTQTPGPTPVPHPSPFNAPGLQPGGRPTDPGLDPTTAPNPGGNGSPFRFPDVDPRDVGTGILGLTGGGMLARHLLKGSIGPSVGVGFPAVTPEMFPKGSFMRTNPATGEDISPSILTPRGRRERLGGAGQWLNELLGTSTNRAQQRKDGRTNITIEQNVTLDPSGMRDLRRQLEEKNRRLEKRIKEFERSMGGGGALMR